ncbi:MAG: hypothetical protein Phog2KO_39730 [Phototrophicaceae bacterium]
MPTIQLIKQMPITAQWYEETQENIHYDVIDIWSWEELSMAIDEAMVLLDSVDYKVNLIIDFTNTNYVPQISYAHLSKVANAPTMTHPNADKFIIIDANNYIGVVLNVFKKLFPFASEKYITIKTHEELNKHL